METSIRIKFKSDLAEGKSTTDLRRILPLTIIFQICVLMAALFSATLAHAQTAKMREKTTLVMNGRVAAMSGVGFGGGVELGLNLGRYFQTVVGFQQTTVDMKEDIQASADDDAKRASTPTAEQIVVNSAYIKGSAALGFMRLFIGNSFNVSFGGGQRQYDYEFDMSSKDGADYVRGSMKVTSTVLYGAIGNQWIFDSGLVLGFEWLGKLLPTKYEFETSYEEQTRSEDQTFQGSSASMKRLAKDLGASDNITMGLSLGFAF